MATKKNAKDTTGTVSDAARDTLFADIFAAANSAGRIAAINTPDNFFPCGFAWVNVAPGTCAFAKWLKRTDRARPSYSGGVDIWIYDYNQSYTRKMAHASAMTTALATTLSAAGFPATITVGGRLD